MVMDFNHFICNFCQFHDNSSSVIIPAERQCLTSQQSMLRDFIVSCLNLILIIITMVEDNRPIPQLQSAHPPTKDTRNWKIYVIKRIKICAEYRGMLPRPRLDLSGTPGLSPGFWQTNHGLGIMSRYSAQVLICTAEGNLPGNVNAV